MEVGVGSKTHFRHPLTGFPEMTFSNAVAWAEELLSRRASGFDYPTGVPTEQDLRIWLAKVRDGLGWKRLCRKYYPKFDLERAKSEVRRSFKRVEKYLTPQAALRRTLQKGDPIRVRAMLRAAPARRIIQKKKAILLVENT